MSVVARPYLAIAGTAGDNSRKGSTMETLLAIVGAVIGLWIYARFSNDAAKEQNRRNLEKLGGQK